MLITAKLGRDGIDKLSVYAIDAPYAINNNAPVFVDNPNNPIYLKQAPVTAPVKFRAVDVIYNPNRLMSELVLSFDFSDVAGLDLVKPFVPYLVLADDPFVSHNGRRFVRSFTNALVDNNYEFELLFSYVENQDTTKLLIERFNPEVVPFYENRDRQIP